MRPATRCPLLVMSLYIATALSVGSTYTSLTLLFCFAKSTISCGTHICSSEPPRMSASRPTLLSCAKMSLRSETCTSVSRHCHSHAPSGHTFKSLYVRSPSTHSLPLWHLVIFGCPPL